MFELTITASASIVNFSVLTANAPTAARDPSNGFPPILGWSPLVMRGDLGAPKAPAAASLPFPPSSPLPVSREDVGAENDLRDARVAVWGLNI